MEIINIVAIIISPLIAVSITFWNQRRVEKKDVKEGVFFTLMENRSNLYISLETVQALHSIDVVFQDDEKVIKLWSDYFDSLSSVGFDEEKNKRLWLDLLAAMAKNLGYKNLTQVQISKVYTPQMYFDQVERYQKMTDNLEKVVEASGKVRTKPRTTKSPAQITKTDNKTN
jgi:hypothetical protein